jgi:CubicO group peptidase (beta-lactamase class C family)
VTINPNLEVNSNTLFQVTSISKSLTAYSALTLVAQKQ